MLSETTCWYIHFSWFFISMCQDISKDLNVWADQYIIFSDYGFINTYSHVEVLCVFLKHMKSHQGIVLSTYYYICTSILRQSYSVIYQYLWLVKGMVKRIKVWLNQYIRSDYSALYFASSLCTSTVIDAVCLK